MFKVNNRNTRTRCETCSKITIKTTDLSELEAYQNSAKQLRWRFLPSLLKASSHMFDRIINTPLLSLIPFRLKKHFFLPQPGLKNVLKLP